MNNIPKEMDINISLMRIYLGFIIVIGHFHDFNENIGYVCSKLLSISVIAVPMFVLISFSLIDIQQIIQNKEKIKLRFERLIIPFVFWGIMTWLGYLFLSIINKRYAVNAMDLLYQLSFGHSVNQPLWYWNNLIIINILFMLTAYWTKEKQFWIFSIYGVLALVLQYTNLNYLLWGGVRGEIKWPLGRICEMIPYAVLGIYVKKYNFRQCIHNNRYIFGFLSCIAIGGINKINIPSCNGFYYQGVRMIVLTFLIFVLFSCLPFNLLPNVIRRYVNEFSKYTMGIVAAHYLIYALMDVYIFQGESPRLDLKWGIVHYVICLGTVILGKKVFKEPIDKAFY